MFIPEDEYKIILKNSIIETIDLIVMDDKNEILLWLRKNNPLKGVYYIPWWRRWKWETINDSIKRKWKEEIWLSIDLNKLSFLWIYDDIYSDSMFDWIGSHCSSITYLYKINDDEIKLIRMDSKQHSDYKFFNIDNDELHPDIQKRVQDIKNKHLF